ncbi:carboxymuconolactone decarboxylase family protein [Phenylobacterium sp.]|jgi:AhpD family alkylhydroperoxidase|uniref:carboxymuconolactone decarboxylase family protein n=1 Tax=Phenylobacterium sp. TaxID=1871053 RepID=UPI002F94FB2F
MHTRLNPHAVAPKAMEPMLALEAYIHGSGLAHSLIELVKTRASQINGCAYCLHMHTHDAREAGESEARLYLLSAWRESRLYTDKERAALAWTEALTRIAETAAPDADYEPLKAHFSEEEIVALTLLITTINAWNRIAIGFRSQHPRDRAPRTAEAA